VEKWWLKRREKGDDKVWSLRLPFLSEVCRDTRLKIELPGQSSRKQFLLPDEQFFSSLPLKLYVVILGITRATWVARRAACLPACLPWLLAARELCVAYLLYKNSGFTRGLVRILFLKRSRGTTSEVSFNSRLYFFPPFCLMPSPWSAEILSTVKSTAMATDSFLMHAEYCVSYPVAYSMKVNRCFY